MNGQQARRWDWRRFSAGLSGVFRVGLGPYLLSRRAIREFQASQRTFELAEFITVVRDLAPKVILEIGSWMGGTLYCWARVSPSDAVFVSVDLPGGNFGGGCSEEHARTFQSFLKPGQTLRCFRGDSHQRETLTAVRTYLAERPVDVLFIDGDHTYDGVKSDYEMYSPLVRPGGLIAFHDILPHPISRDIEVPRFWQELKAATPVREIVDRRAFHQFGCGIGILTRT
jgi:predicted O-methyltransferase YrrM